MSAKPIVKRIVWLQLCVLGVVMLMARELILGHLSSRGFVASVFILFVAVWILLKQLVFNRDLREQALGAPPGGSVDEVTRKRRMLQIKLAKLVIAILAIAALKGLIEIGNAPHWAVIGSEAYYLLLIVIAVQIMRRLKNGLR